MTALAIWGWCAPEGWVDEYWDSAYRPDRDALLDGIAALRPFVRVLDIGCNSGPIRRRMRERFGADWDYVGIDFNEAALGRAREHARDDGRATFHTVDLRTGVLPFEDGAFDVAVSTSVLQCLSPEQLVPILAEIQRVASALVVVEDYGNGEVCTARGWAHNYPPWVIRCWE